MPPANTETMVCTTTPRSSTDAALTSTNHIAHAVMGNVRTATTTEGN